MQPGKDSIRYPEFSAELASMIRKREKSRAARCSAIRIVAIALACSQAPCEGLSGQSPAPSIRVVRASQISTAHPKRPHIESFLAVDPRDSKHLIAASMIGSESGQLGANVYVSFDGGQQWTASRVAARDSALLIGGDPTVYFTREGTPLFMLGTRVHGRPATVMSRSTDGGRSWPSPLVLPYRDRPYIAFDTTGQRLDGTTYIGGQFSSFLLSRSTDSARTFDYAQIISRDIAGVDPTMPIRGVLTDMIVTPSGVLVMPFMSAHDMRDSIQAPPPRDSVAEWKLRVLVSDDGGRTFLAARDGPTLHFLGGFRGLQATGAARATIDQSRGKFRGRIYLTWSDWDAAHKAFVIRVASSGDLGKSWKTTVVNDNTNDHDPNNPAIAVSPDGIVAVVWNDRRDDPENRCWRLYGAISTDGGETFLPNVKLSGAPTCTNAPKNWVLSTWDQYDDWTDPTRPRPGFGLTAMVPVRFPNGGDTQGLVADADGFFHAAWINGETGALQLWYTKFAVAPGIVASVRAQNAEHSAGSAAAPVPAGRVDVTQVLTFVMRDPKIDFAHGTLEVSMRVVNPTNRCVRGPLEVVSDRLISPSAMALGLENFKVANSDNRQEGVGASWTISAGPTRELPPHGKTPPRILRFSFTGGVPAAPEGYFEPAFRIFARDDSAIDSAGVKAVHDPRCEKPETKK
jgi:hypothetical protein